VVHVWDLFLNQECRAPETGSTRRRAADWIIDEGIRPGGSRADKQYVMHHIRAFDVGGGVHAFYDGRVEGYRFAEEPNWVDDGALSLGIASYAVVANSEALIYDTHVSVEHARYVRGALESRGVRKFTVVLSHWHLDHVAGSAIFGDSEIIASHRSGELLSRYGSTTTRPMRSASREPQDSACRHLIGIASAPCAGRAASASVTCQDERKVGWRVRFRAERSERAGGEPADGGRPLGRGCFPPASRAREGQPSSSQPIRRLRRSPLI
jgi:hypothetical protein